MMMLLIILLVVAMLGGGFAHSRAGYAGWSPAAIILVILAILAFTGRL